jgi:hypothetical protein
MYHFMRDDESLAWRVVGLAARMCMELGLHRQETYSSLFDNEEDRVAGLNLFWSIYVLDRRWSFGTGLPFAFQDADIDPLLPRPDDSTPYLAAMVAYSHIGSRVWKSVANADSNAPVSKEDIGYLDYQVLQWLRSIPDSLKYHEHPSRTNDAGRREQHPRNESRGIRRLRVILYLRANQMRILIYRPVLHTATSIMENMSYAQAVVDVAKDTIRVLTHTNQTSDIYRSQQVMFNYFLISALAVLFLAVSHAPAQFSELCREEFYKALDLVRGFSAHSFVSKRLWNTVRVLKQVAPKLGLRAGNDDPDNAVSSGAAGGVSTSSSSPPRRLEAHDSHSAAVAMASLAGHQVDEGFLFGHQQRPEQQQQHEQQQQVNGSGSGSGIGSGGPQPKTDSPNGVANDLTSLFEAVGGFGSMPMPQNGGFLVPPAGDGLEGGAGWQEDELARIMRELF